ncbi:helix-turn-helix transcriptional regulator [Parachryseolinea silvisoli]|uniref:helix-turn-helix transcriptional regulator n=1 Tax=Parachryseolinea silvisoli TaxID=2873601 RepID=UPI0022658A81|nr:AraC family transcriptional regulator [Parachryseolinea silvisoli]MCD9017651.1 AraC family transcriptional regulator [Parachryseolinea silvisoli]
MNQFLLNQGASQELDGFGHIREIGIRKNTSVQLNSLCSTTTDNIRIYYILDGKFEWFIHDRSHILYPGDLAIILPGQSFGGSRGFVDIGTFCWISIEVKHADNSRRMVLGDWSGLSESDSVTISKILQLNNIVVLSKVKEAFIILQAIKDELFQREIGYTTRVNHLIDELLIFIARQSGRQTNLRRDFPEMFTKMEEALRQNLGHQWTVEEMAALIGLGTTAFSEKVKVFTGFSPLNYLINIRISEAIKLLKKPEINVTEIALETGFYSSQHFSTTFKKLTGYTPMEFRKKK